MSLRSHILLTTALSLSPSLTPALHAAPPRPSPTPRPEAAPAPPPPSREELELAKRHGAALALAGQAQEAYRSKRFGEAAELFDKAHLQFAEENFLWNAGQAWERAGELKLAKERYSAYLGNENVDATTRLQAGEALVRVGKKLAARDAAATPQARKDLFQRELREARDADNRELVRRLEAEIAVEDQRIAEIEAARPSTVPGWLMVGGGGAIAIGGLVLTLVGQSKLDGVAEAQSGDGPLVTRMTRTQAASDLEDGEMFRLIGIVAGGVGVASAIVGTIMLTTLEDPSTSTDVLVTATPLPSGLSVDATFRF